MHDFKTLDQTVDLMNSEDYTERFKAEYYQLKIRMAKLEDMIVKYEAGTLNFQPKVTIDVLKNQLEVMRNYLYILAVRAEVEGIAL